MNDAPWQNLVTLTCVAAAAGYLLLRGLRALRGSGSSCSRCPGRCGGSQSLLTLDSLPNSDSSVRSPADSASTS